MADYFNFDLGSMLSGGDYSPPSWLSGIGGSAPSSFNFDWSSILPSDSSTAGYFTKNKFLNDNLLSNLGSSEGADAGVLGNIYNPGGLESLLYNPTGMTNMFQSGSSTPQMSSPSTVASSLPGADEQLKGSSNWWDKLLPSSKTVDRWGPMVGLGVLGTGLGMQGKSPTDITRQREAEAAAANATQQNQASAAGAQDYINKVTDAQGAAKADYRQTAASNKAAYNKKAGSYVADSGSGRNPQAAAYDRNAAAAEAKFLLGLQQQAPTLQAYEDARRNYATQAPNYTTGSTMDNLFSGLSGTAGNLTNLLGMYSLFGNRG